jgi:uncharacterized membrane protein
MNARWTTKKIALMALIIAINVVVAMTLQIPTWYKGDLVLVDAGVILGMMMWGPVEAAIMGGMIGFMFDFFSGWASTMWLTLLVYATEGLIVGFLMKKFGKTQASRMAISLICIPWVVLGNIGFGVFFGNPMLGWMFVLGGTLQTAVSIAVAHILFNVIEKAGLRYK